MNIQFNGVRMVPEKSNARVIKINHGNKEVCNSNFSDKTNNGGIRLTNIDTNNNYNYYVDENNNIVDYMNNENEEYIQPCDSFIQHVIPQNQNIMQPNSAIAYAVNNNEEQNAYENAKCGSNDNVFYRELGESNISNESSVDINNNIELTEKSENGIAKQGQIQFENVSNEIANNNNQENSRINNENKFVYIPPDIYSFNDIHSPSKIQHNSVNMHNIEKSRNSNSMTLPKDDKKLYLQRPNMNDINMANINKRNQMNNMKIMSNKLNLNKNQVKIKSTQGPSHLKVVNTHNFKNNHGTLQKSSNITLQKSFPQSSSIRIMKKIPNENMPMVKKKQNITNKKYKVTENQRIAHQQLQECLESDLDLSCTETDDSTQTDSVFEDNLWNGSRYRFEGQKEIFKWKIPTLKPEPEINPEQIFDEEVQYISKVSRKSQVKRI